MSVKRGIGKTFSVRHPDADKLAVEVVDPVEVEVDMRKRPTPDDVKDIAAMLHAASDAGRAEFLQAVRAKTAEAAARDTQLQESKRKSHQPEIDSWINNELDYRLKPTRPELWDDAPQWIKDRIERDSFLKRVSAVRKSRMGRL